MLLVAFRSWHEADDAAYESLEKKLKSIASPNFTVRRAVVKNLPPFEHNEEPTAAELMAEDIHDRAEMVNVGSELLDHLPDHPIFGSDLAESVKTAIKNGIQRPSFLSRHRRKSRVIKSYRLPTADTPKYGADGLR